MGGSSKAGWPKQSTTEKSEDISNIEYVPPCPSGSQSCDSHTEMDRKRLLVKTMYDSESQVIDVDGEEVIKHGLITELLNSVLPIPKSGNV